MPYPVLTSHVACVVSEFSFGCFLAILIPFCFYLSLKLSAICETAFHYQDKIPPSSYAVHVASNMQVAKIVMTLFLHWE